MNKVVNLRNGFDQISIRLQEFDGAFYVMGASFYGTRQGARVNGTRERKFRRLEEAREYANDWYSKLVKSGWEKVN